MNDRKRLRDEWLCERFPYYRYALELGGENFKIKLSPWVKYLADDLTPGEFIANNSDDNALASDVLADYIAQQGGGDIQSIERDIASFFINISNEKLDAWYDAWEFDHREFDKIPKEKAGRIDQGVALELRKKSAPAMFAAVNKIWDDESDEDDRRLEREENIRVANEKKKDDERKESIFKFVFLLLICVAVATGGLTWAALRHMGENFANAMGFIVLILGIVAVFAFNEKIESWIFSGGLSILRPQKLLERFNKIQKIFFGLACTATILLIITFFDMHDEDLPSGYFVFLRIVTCAALVGLLLEKFPAWVKFALLLLAILYNPIVQIHIGDREVWAWFNAATIPALVAPWAWLLKRSRKI